MPYLEATGGVLYNQQGFISQKARKCYSIEVMGLNKPYYQLIPEKVYDELPVICDLLQSEIKGFNKDYLKEVVSVISCHVRKSEDDPPLRMKYFRRIAPYVERYIKGLISLGIIHRSDNYIPGQISYRYNFTPEYRSRFIALPLKNERLIARIQKAFKKNGEEATKQIWGHATQVKFIKKLTLAPGWMDLVNSYKENINQYNAVLASATRIVNGDFFYSIDKTEGRFHSNLTNMKRELRKYLRINGQPLANVDIKNSQPYLSTLILIFPSKVSPFTQNPAFAMLLQTLKVSQNEDVKRYINLVVSGQLYEFLMGEFAKTGITLDRYATKKQVLRILFAPNRMPKDEINRTCRQVFMKAFPTVHRIFSKVRGRKQGTTFENSNRFVILLAIIESFLLLHVIVKRINRELPNVITITCHDSVFTGILTNDIYAVRKIMHEELTDFVGFSPKIKIEGIEGIKLEETEKKPVLIQYDVTTLVKN